MRRWLGKAETTLGNHSDRLNAINIFPVADGDTGTNLYLTVRAAAHAFDVPETAPGTAGADGGVFVAAAPDPPRTTSGPSWRRQASPPWNRPAAIPAPCSQCS